MKGRGAGSIGGQHRGETENECKKERGQSGALYFLSERCPLVFRDGRDPLSGGGETAADAGKRGSKKALPDGAGKMQDGESVRDTLLPADPAENGMVAGHLPVPFHLSKSVPEERIEPVKRLQRADEQVQQTVLIPAVLQFMKKDEAQLFFGGQDVQILRDEDNGSDEPERNRTLRLAGSVEPHRPPQGQGAPAV